MNLQSFSNTASRYFGAFACGFMAVIGPVIAIGTVPSRPIYVSAALAGLTAVWKLSLVPPAANALAVKATQENH